MLNLAGLLAVRQANLYSGVATSLNGFAGLYRPLELCGLIRSVAAAHARLWRKLA